MVKKYCSFLFTVMPVVKKNCNTSSLNATDDEFKTWFLFSCCLCRHDRSHLPGVFDFSVFSTESAVVVTIIATTMTTSVGVSIVFISLDLPEPQFSLTDNGYPVYLHLLCPSSSSLAVL